jgi:osmoprotectant transport system permease protein
MGDLVGYLRDHAGQVAGLTVEHVTMVVLAVVVAVVIGVPLGIAATRWRRWERVVMGTSNVLQTIPSLALFGFLIPVPFIGGVGARTAIVALTLYALLPIVRGTYAGIRGVEPAVREAGLGLGMTKGQLLRRVELPLAAPVILSGVRVATVISVGIATIAAAIGAGGLGVYIFQGLAMVNDTVILAGAVPAALLALAADALLGRVERRVTPAGHADRRVEKRPA